MKFMPLASLKVSQEFTSERAIEDLEMLFPQVLSFARVLAFWVLPSLALSGSHRRGAAPGPARQCTAGG